MLSVPLFLANSIPDPYSMTSLVDTDMDGINDEFEGMSEDQDTDNDGTYDYLDPDDDNDGVLTIDEQADDNMDGNPDDALDTDQDNLPNYLDNDDDDDGVLTLDEDIGGNGDPTDDDTDGDFVPNFLDDDDDDDGILTKFEGPPGQNTDADADPDYLDNDDDGDGMLTIDEYADPDGNGEPSDALDFDEDAIPNYLDDDTEIVTITITIGSTIELTKVGKCGTDRNCYEQNPGSNTTAKIYWDGSKWVISSFIPQELLLASNSFPSLPDPPCLETGTWEKGFGELSAISAPCIDGDSDEDGVLDKDDNCKFASNPAQTDNNHNGIGDICDIAYNLVELQNAGLYIENPNKGIVLKGMDGKCYQLLVDGQGILVTQGIACP
jgi:hypothetical protein